MVKSEEIYIFKFWKFIKSLLSFQIPTTFAANTKWRWRKQD